MRARSLVLVVASMTWVTNAFGTDSNSNEYLVPSFIPGQIYNNVFSISRSVRVEGFNEFVRRNGGSAEYLALGQRNGSWAFKAIYSYDGQPAQQEISSFRDGGQTYCSNDACAPYLDASGLLYNKALWGMPPHQKLKTGSSWRNEIPVSWELGGAHGTQTVTVIQIDAATKSVTLLREGSANGFFANESQSISVMRDDQVTALTLIPGRASWKGYTTFKRGVVVSDELVVVRADILRDSDGKEYKGAERRIMLLDASPGVPIAEPLG